MKLGLLSMALLAAAFSAHADSGRDFKTVGGMIDRCRTGASMIDSGQGEDFFGAGLCGGFVLAVSQANEAMAEKAFCAPDGVSIDQRGRIFVAWADKHPEALHVPAYWGFVAAMKGAFPCQ